MVGPGCCWISDEVGLCHECHRWRVRQLGKKCFGPDYAECPKCTASSAAPPKAMKPTKKWKWLPKYAKFCDDESVEKDYAIKEPKVCDDEIDDERWEVLVLGYEWRRGRPKFQYIVIEKEDKAYELE